MKQQHFLQILSILFIGSSFSTLEAQVIGGSGVYEFLNLPVSARISGLGGTVLGVQDADLNIALANPAALNPKNHKQIALNHSFHLSDSQHGYAGYAHHSEPLNTTFQAGIQYVNYGNFVLADDIGNKQGEFTAKEFAVNVSAGKELYENLSVGASLKMMSSQLEGYESFGMAVDLGAFYRDTSGRFGIGMVIKNAGLQFNPYVAGNREPIPFDIQIGLNQSLKHLPFRFGIVAHDLHRWNILYDDPNTVDNDILTDFNDTNATSPTGDFIDNFFRHLIFSGEFLFGKAENLTLQFAYNHQRRQELSVSYASRSLTGFSMGVGLKIKRFRVHFGHQFYHLAGGNNHFSITTDLQRW